ncbi:MAG: hypothetical protein QOH02_741 [Gaiellaceae bacterium]|jgi:hypothetical protein|nr:hypothetical protein [Gaiellaceae bacterium]
MRAFLSSPRRRKRLGYLGVALALVGTAVGVGVTHQDTAHHFRQRFHGGPPQVVVTPRHAPFTAADRRRAEEALQFFVDHAVARHDPAVAYDVVTPGMRRGSTRKGWAAGNVPVYPYPAARQHVQIAWVWASYRNEVDFDVVLLPRKGAHVGPVAAGVDMKATGSGAHRRWRVDSFTPRQFYAP